MTRRSAKPLIAPRVSESVFQSHLAAALNAPGRSLRCWRVNCGTLIQRDEKGRRLSVIHGAPTGAADLQGVIRPEGLHISIEVKSATARHTDEQKRWARIIEGLGGIYVLIRYDQHDSFDANVARGLALVDEAIERRRRPSVWFDGVRKRAPGCAP